MKTHRLIEIIGETIGLICLAGASMNCTSHDDGGPATCEEAKDAYGVSVDGPQVLYIGGNKTMPWLAYCDAMATKKPVEYVELNTHDGRANFSEFSERTASSGFKVRTQFRKVRIDPANLTIDSTDAKFSDKQITGGNKFSDRPLTPPNPSPMSAVLSKMVDYMPYAAAETCGNPFNESGGAQANVDLSNSPFEVATMPCKTIGENTVTFDDSPRQMLDFRSTGGGGGDDAMTATCGHASLNCLPDPIVNGEVGGQGKLQLRYIGYGQSSGDTRTGPIVSGLNPAKCVDLNNGAAVPGNKVQMLDCNGFAAAQSWTINGDGTITIDGGCLASVKNNFFNGTPIQWSPCDGGKNQQWQAVNGQLINSATGKCLDDPSGNTNNGTLLVQWECHSDGVNQQWRLP